MKNFTAVLQHFEDNLWSFFLDVPDEIANHFLEEEGNRRVVTTYNGSKEVQCALFPKGNDIWFLNLNKEIRKKLNLTPGNEVAVTIKRDESDYGMSLPEEISELWAIDDEAKDIFHKLTKGKQRSLLHIIGKPKTSDTRLKKALIISDYLKSTRGKLDYTELNEAFKNRKNDY